MANLKEIENYIDNKLPEIKAEYVIGIIGENPSVTARSPYVWNPVLEDFGLNSYFYCFDVKRKNLKALVGALKANDSVLGFSVTKPYKKEVIKYLDSLDEKAKQIGAVNTVVRGNLGYLGGYNTDGMGAVLALTKSYTQPFIDLNEKNILLIGAGGAGRAVAFYLAEAISPKTALKPKLLIVNRNVASAETLSCDVNHYYKKEVSTFECEDELIDILSKREFDLVVNATTKGQAGLVYDRPGRKVTTLEHYSSLAQASPVYFTPLGNFYKRFIESCDLDIQINNSVSRKIVSAKNLENAKFFDVIFSPRETIMLRDARLSGHDTLNGISMNKYQALEAMRLILAPRLSFAHPPDLRSDFSMFEEEKDILTRLEEKVLSS